MKDTEAQQIAKDHASIIRDKHPLVAEAIDRLIELADIQPERTGIEWVDRYNILEVK